MAAISDSRPPNPPLRAPNDDEWRFKIITSPCEWIEDYRPGGYHPVHLGDVFDDGRYRVIRKLGDGAYSTVWLARDLKNSTYVALRILILRYIAENAPTEGGRHITQLLGEFKHHGPNGIHTCLVFEPMGPTVNTMVEELPQFNPRRLGMKVRYPPQMAKRILKQSLQALAFLHENGIAHGDFQPGNMLFALNDINSMPEEALQQETGSISPLPLMAFTPYAEGFKLKLSDMGGAYFFTDPPAKLVTPLGLRAPELILTRSVGRTLDVWSFGCLVFELITGRPLFCVPPSDFENDDHLLSLSARLGALPDTLFQHWKTSSLYFTPERELFNCELGGVPDGGEPLMIPQRSMEELFNEAGPDLSEEEADKTKKLIRRVLQYDPAKRPSPTELLSDPWFCEGEEGSS